MDFKALHIKDGNKSLACAVIHSINRLSRMDSICVVVSPVELWVSDEFTPKDTELREILSKFTKEMNEWKAAMDAVMDDVKPRI